MTIIEVSVNGNYKTPVKVTRQDGSEENYVVSGHGLDWPNVLSFTNYGVNAFMAVEIGPEEPDNGEG